MSEGVFKRHLLATRRGAYRDMKTNDSKCLFCSVMGKIPDELPAVVDADAAFYIIKIYKSYVLVVNPFPYSPRGHLEVLSKRHVEKIHELTKEEFSELQDVINESLEALSNAYNVENFNIGINMGKLAGASHAHFHMHIVPRSEAESGFLEATSSTRVISEEPEQTMRKVAENIK